VLLLCQDLGVSPEDPVLIALSHAMGARQMGAFGRAEFERGMQALEVCTPEKLREALPRLRARLDPAQAEPFLELYKFAHSWACEPGQKSVGKDTACALWHLLLGPLKWPLLGDWVDFVQHSSVRGLTRDVWLQTLLFARHLQRSGNDLRSADLESGAWPVLIDEFVEFKLNGRTCPR
jgi:DCN1-like protein 1/2